MSLTRVLYFCLFAVLTSGRTVHRNPGRSRIAVGRRASIAAIPLGLLLSRINRRSSAIEIEDRTSFDWKKFDEVRSDKRAQNGYPNRCGYDYCMNGNIVVPIKDEEGNEKWVLKDGPEDTAYRLKQLEARKNVRTRPKYKSAY
ncbi:hypothetical protein AAMO2058_001567300 [Amorphochlora amoebiformis]